MLKHQSMLLGHDTLPGNSLLRRVSPVTGELSAADTRRRSEFGERRRRGLLRVDGELQKGNYGNALSLVKQLQGQHGGLRCFGAAGQIPKKLGAMEDPKLSGRDLSCLESMTVEVMDLIRRCIEFASMEEAHTNAVERLELEEGSNPLSQEESLMCAQHEAGHFLVGYLLGVLPKEYKLLKNRTQGQTQFAGGKVNFLGFEFLRQVRFTGSKNIKGHVSCSSKVLNNFSCVILGGLVAEQIGFGYSEGLHSDIDKLQRVIKWVRMTQVEADVHVRWAAMNTIYILDKHKDTVSRLAEAMASGRSIGSCINTIEDSLFCKTEI